MAVLRRRGEDGISFEHRRPCRDPERHRHCPGLWRGEFTLSYTNGKRTRRKASGKTKAAVFDKLRQLHHELDKGIVPKTGYANYTVRQAAEDWLANGLGGRSAKTIKKNQNVLEPRCTVEWLMRELGLAGARHGKRVRTTVPDLAAARPVDLVGRRSARPRRTAVGDRVPRSGSRQPSVVDDRGESRDDVEHGEE